MDATDKDLQELLDERWKASDTYGVLTSSGRQVCDMYGMIGYSDGERKVAERIAQDHNELAALRAVLHSAQEVILTAKAWDMADTSYEVGGDPVRRFLSYLCDPDKLEALRTAVQEAQAQAAGKGEEVER